ncbi:MAG: sugar transferase [Patescibacteria group bacterium]|nr:sugar transferase [Patescibacteria group bacterium]
MKKFQLFFSALLLPLDFLMLALAAATAYFLRFQSAAVTELRPVIYELPFRDYFGASMIIATAWLLIFAAAGLYQIKRRKVSNEFVRILLACSTGILAVIVLIFFQRELFSSRFLVIAAWIFSILFVALARLIVRVIQHTLYRAGVGLNRVIVIGSDKITDNIIHLLRANPGLGFAVVANFNSFDTTIEREILKIHGRERIDEILLSDPRAAKGLALKILSFADEHHIIFKYTADLFATQATNITFETLAGIPIIEMARTPLRGWGRILKRAFDITGSLFLIVITSPLLTLTAIIIRLESRGPIIFKNERVGVFGKKFFTYKFRSMYKEYCIGAQFKNQNKALELEQRLIKERSIKEGPVYKIADDPRVTRVGRFIRRFSIDELPQFFNVLAGSMSLVGPRPHQPREVENYAAEQKQIHFIRPGVTGLAQISGRSDLEFEEEARLDIYYIEHWSLWLDIWILLKTPFVVIQRKGVY